MKAAITNAKNPADPVWIGIRDQIYRLSGIYQAENKFRFLIRTATRRMKAIGACSPQEYFSYLSAQQTGKAEMSSLLNEMSIGGTYLFRNLAQIDALRKIVIPLLTEATAKQSPRKLRFWSAGCSTGEEAHTIAMILIDEAPSMPRGWALELLGTDMNDAALATARLGIYGKNATRNVPATFMEKYFTKVGSQFRVVDSVRDIISFASLNLSDEGEMQLQCGFDVISCCNVLIYFDEQSKTRAIRGLCDALLPGGFLCLGPSESLAGISQQFCPVNLPEAATYRKTRASILLAASL